MCGLSLNRAKDFSNAKHDPILDSSLAIVDSSSEHELQSGSCCLKKGPTGVGKLNRLQAPATKGRASHQTDGASDRMRAERS